jgi:hypothetical protein
LRANLLKSLQNRSPDNFFLKSLQKRVFG